MHGPVPASANTESMGDDRKPEHLFRSGDPLVTFGHPALYGDKGDGRDVDQDHFHSLGKSD